MTDFQSSIDPARIEALRHHNIGRLFLRAHRAYSTRAIELLREYGHDGLTLAHTNLLSNLDTAGTRITKLAELAGMTKQSTSQLVVDLEQRGYVERAADPSDARAAIIYFKEKGKQFLEDAFHVKLKLHVEYANILGDAEFQQLCGTLYKLLEAIEQPE